MKKGRIIFDSFNGHWRRGWPTVEKSDLLFAASVLCFVAAILIFVYSRLI